MTIEWILHARYMTPSVDRGSNNYGGQDFGSPCLSDDRKEEPFTSETADVSRNSLNYFASAPSIYMSTGLSGTIETGNGNKQAVNRAANFMGNDYVLIGNNVYIWNDNTSQWNISTALTSKTGTETSSIGLYPVFIGGAPCLITAWRTGASTWRYAILNGNTNTWTISANSALTHVFSDANGGILNEIQHGSKIYFITSGETNIYWFDFIIGGFGSTPFSSTSRHPMDMASYMGKLFILNKNASGSVQVLRVDSNGTTFQLNHDTGVTSDVPSFDVGETLTTTSQFEGRPLLFVDNVYDSGSAGGATNEPTLWSYYISHAQSESPIDSGDTNHGLRPEAMRLDFNGTLQNVGAAGIVTGFRANPFKMAQNQEGTVPFGTTSRKDEDIVLRLFANQKSRGINGDGKSSLVCATRFAGQLCTGSPGGGGDFGNLFYHTFRGSGNASGGNHPNPPTKDGGAHAFEFIGHPAKQVRHRAIPHGQLGGGARLSEIDGNLDRVADIVFRGSSPTAEDGIIRISYSIIPSVANPSGTVVDVRWWHDKNGHLPESPCTLVGTSHGAISGIYAVSIPISPGDIYYVDWDAKGNGLTRGVMYSLNGQINLDNIELGAITDPTDLSNLVSWFDATDEATITSGVGGDVSQWDDKSTGLSGMFQPTFGNRPTWSLDGSGIGRVTFVAANSQFMFSSGAPITGGESTILAVYRLDNNSFSTIFSMSNDTARSGDSSYEYVNITRQFDGTIDFVDQDWFRQQSPMAERVLTVPSGGESNKTRLLVWRQAAFEGRGTIFPGGQYQETEFTVDGSVEATGLDNTTFGRFSGAQISGVYGDAGAYTDGKIYELAIYNRTLSESEINRFNLYVENKYSLDV